MQYRKGAGGKEWSALGFGCMRFPRNGNSIDTDATEKIILRAAELGVNYFDTAYIYPGSEECLGTILEKNGIMVIDGSMSTALEALGADNSSKLWTAAARFGRF